MQAARDLPLKRFSNSGSSDIICNADMRVGEIRQFCKLQEEGQSLMRAAMSQLNFSARAYHRTQSVKLARTIADLAGSEEIRSQHLAEAVQYRPKMIMGNPSRLFFYLSQQTFHNCLKRFFSGVSLDGFNLRLS